MTPSPTELRKFALKIGHTRLVLFGVGTVSLLALTVAGGLDSKSSTAAPPRLPTAIAVDTALATESDVPVYLGGLGTVQAFYTVTVSPRVDGELMKVGFTEGQMVKQGDLLAQIDPRPYQATYDQAVATKDKDVAQLANAQRDLDRYVHACAAELHQQASARHPARPRRAAAGADQGRPGLDRQRQDPARLYDDQLADPRPYRHPPGRSRQQSTCRLDDRHRRRHPDAADLGDLHPAGRGSGRRQCRHGERRAGCNGHVARRQDGTGHRLSDAGRQPDRPDDRTIKLKATFPNQDNKLWPGEFVNAKVLAQTRRDALSIPSAAIQRGPTGVFTYVVKPDSTVEMRQIEVADDVNGRTVVTGGLKAGERVTVSNEYRLQPGTKVSYAQPGDGQAAPDQKPAQGQSPTP